MEALANGCSSNVLKRRSIGPSRSSSMIALISRNDEVIVLSRSAARACWYGSLPPSGMTPST
jgi:hypothetical protein